MRKCGYLLKITSLIYVCISPKLNFTYIYKKYIHKFQLTDIAGINSASLWLQFLLHQERNRDSIDLFFIQEKQDM